MTSKLKKAIAIACLFSLIIASVAVADAQEERRPQPRQGRGGYRDSRGAEGGPGRGYGGGRGGYGGGMRGMSPGMGIGRGMQTELIPQVIRQRLNLTEKQEQELEDIQKQQIKKSQELAKTHQDLKNKLDSAIDKSDKETIAKIAQEMGKNIADTALLKVSGKESLKEILNEDQLKTLERFNKQRAEMREKMRKQMEERRTRDRDYRNNRFQDRDRQTAPARRKGRDQNKSGVRGRNRDRAGDNEY